MASSLFKIAAAAAKRLVGRIFSGGSRLAPAAPPVSQPAIEKAAAEALRNLNAPRAEQQEMAAAIAGMLRPIVHPHPSTARTIKQPTAHFHPEDVKKAIQQAAQQQKTRPTPPSTPPQPDADEWPAERTIELLGRGDIGYYEPGTQALIDREIETPHSSNVYSFVYQPETRRDGILYVTFKAWQPGQKDRPHSAGPTYAYYNVPLKIYLRFAADAQASPGGAVWDHLRQRGTIYGHHYPYRLVSGSPTSTGAYVARKATPKGLKSRSVPGFGTGRRAATRSQLPERNYRGKINRGNSGKPNTGRP